MSRKATPRRDGILVTLDLALDKLRQPVPSRGYSQTRCLLIVVLPQLPKPRGFSGHSEIEIHPFGARTRSDRFSH
jgi:hypothetical protein